MTSTPPTTRCCWPTVWPGSTTPHCSSRRATRCSPTRRLRRPRAGRSSTSPRPGRARTCSSSATCRASDDAGDPTAATDRHRRPPTTALTTSNFAGLYWPHIVVGDVVGVGRNPTITLPPSGYIAGLFARTDGRRGVWKAPAGTEATLLGTIALEYQLNDLHSDELNPRASTRCARSRAPGRVVWGARTQVPASEWRYVPVRRTAIFLRTSIYNGIQWAVFEPNDEPLWASLRASIGGFMETQFRNGAFAGRTSRRGLLRQGRLGDDDRDRPGRGRGQHPRRVRAAPPGGVRRREAQPEDPIRRLRRSSWPQFTVNTHRLDPYKNFKFRVKWDNQYVAGLSKMSAIKRSTEAIEWREAGGPSIVRKLPGRTKFEPVTLESGSPTTSS